jgi:hypothetical protein
MDEPKKEDLTVPENLNKLSKVLLFIILDRKYGLGCN